MKNKVLVFLAIATPLLVACEQEVRIVEPVTCLKTPTLVGIAAILLIWRLKNG